MLKLFESTPGTPVMSLRSGGQVASVRGPIINPNNLFIEGWHVQDSRSGHELILMSIDIREVLPQGFAIDDHEVLAERNELIRLEEILKMNFNVLGLKVTTQSGKSYGKIADFAYETGSMYIQKLYASQSLVKNFSGGMLSIDRTQIIEVTNRRIIIDEPIERAGAAATSPAAS
jgi:uncharacterized protein YrrD